jgi:hypothetical protein
VLTGYDLHNPYAVTSGNIIVHRGIVDEAINVVHHVIQDGLRL